MSADLLPCPNPKCGYWNPVGRATCVRCRRDLGRVAEVASASGMGGKRQAMLLGALVTAFVVLVGLWWMWESNWSDKEPPVVVISSPQESEVVVSKNVVEIKGALQDKNPSRVVSGKVEAEVHKGEFLIQAPVPEGGGEVSIVGYDKRGNASKPAVIKVAIDSVPPEITGVVPADGALVYLAAATVSGAASENIASAQINGQPANVDGAEFNAAVSLQPGANAIKVVVKDKAGNAAERTISVTLQERQLPTGLKPTGRTPQGYDVFTSSVDGSQLVLIPAGAFSMGSEAFQPDEKPVHSVTVSDFFIDQSPVTNAQYRKFCDATNRDYPPAPDFDENYIENAPDSPVTNVTWADARDYAAWAGRRLLTEAEWEKAARGANALKFPWGETAPNSDAPRANIRGNADGFDNTSPVGKYPDGASPYGVMDMAGNVWEWTADYFDDKYYRSSPPADPPGPATGGDRALRGGAYTSDANDVRTTNRYAKPPDTQEDNIGFRTGASFP